MRHIEFIMTIEVLNDIVNLAKQDEVYLCELEDVATRLNFVSRFFNSKQHKEYMQVSSDLQDGIRYIRFPNNFNPLQAVKMRNYFSELRLYSHALNLRCFVLVEDENIQYSM